MTNQPESSPISQTSTNSDIKQTPHNNKERDVSEILNINVGVLGHVDSGKTSLVKAMSTLLSTASLDKSTQSRQRGMTLDLGFSCFFVSTIPKHIQAAFPNKRQLQITLVDCPGHASLIRTIIGGAQIIDIVLLVVDAVKGWQAQTTECLVLAELCTSQIVVALNKVDCIPFDDRLKKIQEVQTHIQKTYLNRTRFALPNIITPMIGVSACVGGEKVAAILPTGTVNNNNNNNNTDHQLKHDQNDENYQASQNMDCNNVAIQKNETLNIDVLISTLIEQIPIPQRMTSSSLTNNTNAANTTKPVFYFAIDHCFPIRGRGTVITGTCLSGSISVNDTIHFPTISVERKIKSIQMFKRSVSTISQGDRAGICVSHFDATIIERSIAAAPPGSIQLWKGAIAIVKKVSYYKQPLLCNSKFHISVGHATVMATVSFWGARELVSYFASTKNHNKGDQESNSIRNASEDSKRNKNEVLPNVLYFGGSAETAGLPQLTYDFNQNFVYQERLVEHLDDRNNDDELQQQEQLLNFAILEFSTPIHCPMHCLIIGSRLDTVDNSTKAASTCRLAFSGRLIERIDPTKDAQRIRLYNNKEKSGVVSKLGDPHKRTDDEKVVRYEVFGSDLFKKETNMKLFVGMKVVTNSNEVGEIKSSFGTDGNFRVVFPAGTEAKVGDPLILRYQRFVHDPTKTMHQDIKLPLPRSGSRIEAVVKKKAKKLDPGVNKFGLVDSLKGDVLDNGKQSMAIISGMFAPEINIKDKIGTVVFIPSTGECGKIIGPFGKNGKCKCAFDQGISAKVGDKAEQRP